MKNYYDRYRASKKRRRGLGKNSDGYCYYCGKEMLESEKVSDHIIPFRICHDSGVGNVVECCRSCNATKGSRTLGQFREIMKKRFGVAEYKFHFEKYIPTGEVGVNDYFAKMYDFK